MCIVFLMYGTLPHYPLVLAANRDEFFERPTASMGLWPEAPHVLAGKDLRAGGTWLGISRRGYMAALTNYRGQSAKPNAPSRGGLVAKFLSDEPSLEDFCEHLNREGERYYGFNLIFGRPDKLYYYSNLEGEPRPLEHGVYGLSNHLLDTPWPKVALGKELLAKLALNPNAFSENILFEMLCSELRPPDHLLPETGVGLQLERLLGSIFVAGTTYGTRSSTVIQIDNSGYVLAEERSFIFPTKNFKTSRFQFKLQP